MNGTKEVFQLRREGRLQEALQLARQLYAENPADPWNNKALFWSLYSVWKDCGQPAQKRYVAEEIFALQMPADDQMAQHALDAVRRAHDPAAPVIAKARELSQAGNHEQAAATLESFLHQHPDNSAVQTSLAWEIWWQLNGLLKEEKPPVRDIGNLVRRYARCGAVERPSIIHSRMLEIVARAGCAKAFPKFCAFLDWWGATANIRTEDLTGQAKDDGHEFRSVVQHAVAAIGKTIEDEPDEDHAQTALEFMETYVPYYPKEEWFSYYLGLGLCRVGRLDEALNRLIPIARSKSGEFWVWHKLAACFPADDIRRLACLCRSVLCKVRGPEFLLTVRHDLASALHAFGHDDVARHEIELVIELRQQHQNDGWKIPPELASLQEQGWFKAAEPKDGTDLFRTLAKQADDILMHSIPWTRALLQARDVPGQKAPLAIVLLELPTGPETVRLRMTAFDVLGDLQPGTPISVRVTTADDHKHVLALERRDGQPWDLLPEFSAIVTRMNQHKGVTNLLLLSSGETSLAHHDDLPEAAKLHPGNFVHVRSTAGRDVKHARTLRASFQPDPSPFWKSFEGLFRPREKGGGHVGDVFVPAYLVDGVSVASKVSGLAVKQRGDRGDSWWVAIKITQSQFAENTE